MTQQSIFGRIAQLTRANINAILDSAEDPQLMLDQMVRDYTSNIAEAEDAIAQTIGSLRLLEDDAAEAEQVAADWGRKAAAASRKADEMRKSEAESGDAEKFDNLARVALKRQIDFEQQIVSFQPSLGQQREVVDQLKAGIEQMHLKLEELRAKRNELVSRAKMAEAQSRVHEAVRSVDIMNPTSEASRFEEKIRREEARIRGHAELAASSLDAQFESLDDNAEDTEVEARLAALKSS